MSSQIGAGLFLTQPDNPKVRRIKKYKYLIEKSIPSKRKFTLIIVENR